MTRYLVSAAVVLIGIGMILVYAGVMGSGMIVTGAAVIAFGILLAACAGIMSVLSNRSLRAQSDVEPLS